MNEFKVSLSTSSVEEVSEAAPGAGRSLSVLGSAQGGGVCGGVSEMHPALSSKLSAQSASWCFPWDPQPLTSAGGAREARGPAS